jgi:hydrogenase expression/formation protein HypE
MTSDAPFGDGGLAPSCPVPSGGGDTVQLAHGGGGRAMARLIDTLIRPAFADLGLEHRHDGAIIDPGGPAAFTTDSYVVRPLFFPGGDIGALAVNGTVNDLAMCGARPLALSVGLILEEGLPLDVLRRVLASMRAAALAAGVRLATGDTKVVDRGKADGLFVSTAGVGRIVASAPVGPGRVRAGDVVILSGDIGRHGIAVLAAREQLGLESAIASDTASIAAPALALIEAGLAVHCLRDLTRGGLASAAVEIAGSVGLAIALDEARIPVRADVAAACELLGLDPLHVANEGRFIAFVPEADADRALATLRDHDVSAGAVAIGRVAAAPAGRVTAIGPLGVARVVDMLNGEQLPRIC